MLKAGLSDHYLVYCTRKFPGSIKHQHTYIKSWPLKNFNQETFLSDLYEVDQARSQVCVAGVADLPCRNHVVQNLRAYSILHVVKIKWIMCVQENIELSTMSQRSRLSSSIISGDFSFAATTTMQ